MVDPKTLPTTTLLAEYVPLMLKGQRSAEDIDGMHYPALTDEESSRLALLGAEIDRRLPIPG